MSTVIDCSMALSWHLPDETNLQSNIVLDLVKDGGGIVPALFRMEFVNALGMAIKRNRITIEYRNEVVVQFRSLQVETDYQGLEMVWEHTMALADEHDLTIYDATYLELAMRLGKPLATFDKQLARAARRCGMEVRGIIQ